MDMKSSFLIAALAFTFSACASIPLPWKKNDDPERATGTLREDIAAHPGFVRPRPGKSTTVWTEAMDQKGTRIVISTAERSLWLMRDTAVLFKAPVAIGRSKPLIYKGKQYDFNTPLGKRKVLSKGTAPLWVPPDWHYFEIAQERSLEPVFLKKT